MKYNLLFLGALVSIVGCTQRPKIETIKKSFRPKQHLFFKDYDKVWRATQISLQKYPIRINNIDTGHLETQFITTNTLWKEAHIKNPKNSNTRYKLKVNVIKGNVKKRSSVKVTISKKIVRQKDFFSTDEPIPSNGIEEEMILYRIGRELIIEKALERDNSRNQK